MGYLFGSAYSGLDSRKSFYGPEKLLDEGICLVVIAYRLGIAGFLSTEDKVIPGNFGLKDQALALKWVKENIHNFGGDPDSITLMGESSGAGSAHLHLFSPLTRDLFHRVIMDSGSGYCPWGFSRPGEHIKKAKRLAEMCNCPFDSSSKFLTCMQNTSMTYILNMTNRFIVSKYESDPVAFFNPVIEKKCVKDAFINLNPYNLRSTKPLLAGFNYAEGMMKVGSLTTGNVEAKFKEWNEDFEKITAARLLYYNRVPESDIPDVAKRVRDFYFGADNKVVSPTMVAPMVQMCGDFWFTNGAIDAVESHCGPKWFYHFNFNTSESVCSNIYNNTLYAGACHLDELMYMFPMAVTSNIFDKSGTPENELSKKMVKLWTSFIKNSVPTADGVTWNPVKSTDIEYLEITNSGFSMKKQPIKKRHEFWKSLHGLAVETKEKLIVYS